jgi:hypothetical protein
VDDVPALEDRLLGGLLVGLVHWPAAVEAAVAALEPRHFAAAANRAVFGAVVTLRCAGALVDLPAVYNRLIYVGQDNEAGGSVRLFDLWTTACDPAEVDDLAAALVREDRPEPPPRVYVRDAAPPPADDSVGEVSFDFGYNVVGGEPDPAGV